MKSFLFIGVALLATTTARRVNPTKYHKRRHLKELSRKDHQEMFVPVLDEATNSYSHHVHVEDEQNKHLEFHFEATLHPNTHVLALSDPGHRTNITDIVCADRHMKLYPVDVDYYHQHIQSQLDSKKKVFIPDVCDKQSTNIRRVHSIHKDDGGLLLASTTEDHLDMFDEYFLEFKSDASVHIHHDTDDRGDLIHRRRLTECDEDDHVIISDETLHFAFDAADKLGQFKKKIKRALNIFKAVRKLFEDLFGILESIFDGVHEDDIDKLIGEGMHCRRESPQQLDMGDGQCEDCYFDFNFGVYLMMRKGLIPLEWKITLQASAETGMKVSTDLGIDAHTKPIRTKKPLTIVEGFKIFGFDLDVHLLPSVTFAASIETEATMDFKFSSDNPLELGLQNGDQIKGLFSFLDPVPFPKVVHNVPHKISSDELKIHTKAMDDLKGTAVQLSARIVFAVTFVKILEIDFVVEPHVDIRLFNKHKVPKDDPKYHKDCVLYWASKAYSVFYIQPRITWPFDYNVPIGELSRLERIKAAKAKGNNKFNNYHCLTKRGDTYSTSYTDDDSRRRRSLLPSNIPQLESFEYLTDFKSLELPSHYGIPSSWGIPHTMWWGNVTSVTELCADNYGAQCAGFPVPPTGSLALEYLSEHMLFGTYTTSFDMPVYHNTSWLDVSIVNRTLLNETSVIYVEISCITSLNFSQTSAYLSDVNLYEYDVSIVDWYCNLVGTNHSLNIEDETWKCMLSLPDKMDVIALDVSFESIVLFDSENWCRVFPLTLRDGYLLDSHYFNFSYVAPLWHGSFHCDGSAMDLALYFDVIEEDGTVGCVLEFGGNKTNYLEGKLDFDAMTMVLNDAYDYAADQTSDGTLKFIGVLTALDDGTILYSGSVKWLQCTGFVIAGHTRIVEYNNISTTESDVDDDDSDDLIDLDNFDVMVKEYALYSFIAAVSLLVVVFILLIVVCRQRKSSHDGEFDGQSAHTH